MPELPEVESVRRSLEPYLPGRRIERVTVRDSKVLVLPQAEQLARWLTGAVFQELRRKGKQLYFVLDTHTLFVHLGMTGQLTVRDPQRADRPFHRQPETGLQRTIQHPVDAHTHVSLLLDNGCEVHYRDVRKFGKWRLYESSDPAIEHEVARLGPDPLTPEFTLAHFANALARTQRSVKAVLLDQGVLAGVGNIYADEALFVAGVRPEKTASKLGRERVKRLYRAVIQVLEQGLRDGGTTLRDYLNADGEAGTHQETLWVYGRYGEPCRTCGTTLVRSLVAQRTSTCCPRCQR